MTIISHKGKSMKISFKPLSEADFTLLLKWLETPHVKSWWDQDIKWDFELIREKFIGCVKGYKVVDGAANPLCACIIYVDDIPIGYIQMYNAYDFARTVPLVRLPPNLGAFDIFIGEEKYLNKGVGSKAIVQFLKEYGDSYTHIFVDPQSNNFAAIRTYEKAGFKKNIEQPVTGELWMTREQSSDLHKQIQQLELSLLTPSVRKSLVQLNKLIANDFIEFGSSGKVYNKQDCMALDEKLREFKVIDFKIKELSKEVILATYKTIENGDVSLRSSIWKHYGDGWQMVFHQGTKV